MKLKMPSRVQWLMIAAVAVAIVLVMGNRDRSAEPEAAGRLDDAAKTTCDSFAKSYPGAKTKTARLALADRTLASSARTDNDAISKRAGDLGRNADDGATWKSSADALIGACQNAGWTTP
ncbi:hypothetical protein [Actinoplanes derwentensis]|uniref:Uncharacterized protein n=1 Tax=Actinoplanes derwentensis TaxID=113562 RepID=A0A1H2CIB5_9ACTN|nr:hypothetical protein [Actinoplanes derwentensis]GID90045.1 hypothetical protein Ade03nite_89690 [Actinoplanes derwentensis]SDT70238.1 hypothetical protein SAMN04489716_5913 [Actinoplanes derwentensis]